MTIKELEIQIRSLSRKELVELTEACDDLFAEFYDTGESYPEPYYLYDKDGNKTETTLDMGLRYYSVTLESVTDKVAVMKVMRSLNPKLTLKEAMYVVQNTPFCLGTSILEPRAKDAKEKIEAAGAVVALDKELE